MIIEAGYDLHLLLFGGSRSRNALRMVCLNDELRVVDICTVMPEFSGHFDETVLDVIERATPERSDSLAHLNTRYVALGYGVADTSQYPHGFDWPRLTALSEWLECHGIQLLTVQVGGDDGWASSGPMHSFASYPGHDDLPRALVIPGPHPFGSCECPACATTRRPSASTVVDV